MSSRPLWIAALCVIGCAKEEPATDDVVDVSATCGDGELDAGELCDEGDANSDTTANSCRTDCRDARCGDGAVDDDEACDDGNALGGDGCDPACHAESGPLEVEPNDLPFLATPAEPGTTVTGGLSDGDVDCYAVPVGENGFLSAAATGPDGACPPETVLRLYDASGALLTAAYPTAADVCARLDPNLDDDARYLSAGTYTVCVEGMFRTSVPTYRLSLEVGDDSCLTGAITTDPEDDADLDGLADNCDSDDDGDGVPDETDNCPRAPNGGASASFATTDRGYVRQWLLAGPLTGNAVGPNGACDPSVASLIGDDDASTIPVVGQPVGGGTWRPWASAARELDFATILGGKADREAYAVTWVRASTHVEATLAYGADDGSSVWFDGELLGTDPTCHGVVTDSLQYPVTLSIGWHRVMVKVRDHGGGWGMRLRFLTTAGAAIEDLEVSLTADTSWFDNQGDHDGDGVGDVCDPTP